MSALFRKLLRASCVLVAALGVSCGATSGPVVHPEPGEPNKDDYCAKASPEENNCMACTAKPGCGYCPDAPADS